MRVAFTWYPVGGEQTVWTDMEQVPAVGDTVHFNDSAWVVQHVSWAEDELAEGWHAELSVR